MFTAKENRKRHLQLTYLFEVLRALVRSVEWGGVSGVDSPGPPQRQRSQQCVRPLPGARSMDPVVRNRF